MDISEIYLSGISKARYHFIINPLRKILFRLMQPYLGIIVNRGVWKNENDLFLKNIDFKFNTIEKQLNDVKTTQVKMLGLVNTDYGVLLTKPGEVISDAVIAGNMWDEHIIELAARVAKERNGCAVDVGGHIGVMALVFGKLFEHVYSFEPNDFNFRILHTNMTLNRLTNVTCINECLYSCSAVLSLGTNLQQEVDLPLNDKYAFDGQIAENLGAYLFSEAGSGLFTHTANTLDSYQLDKVSFIKVDVQGADGEVLMGALYTIARCRPVIVFE